MTSWAAITAIGPAALEIERVKDLIASIAHYEPQTRWFVIVDNSPVSRNLESVIQAPPGMKLVSLHNPPAGRGNGVFGGLCTNKLVVYAWLARNCDADFVVSLDSDALVIAPFAQPIIEAMKAHPNGGVFGAYLRGPRGVPRGFEGMAGLTRRMSKFALFEYEPNRFGRRFPLALAGRPAAMRRHILDALRNGYEWGHHALGGSYAITRTLLQRMQQQGYFNDPTIWRDSDMGEDVMMGIYCRACNLDIIQLADPGQVFGVKHIGLPYPIEEMFDQGFSIIHSIKNDENKTEEEIRAYCKARREGTPAGNVSPATPANA